MGHEGFKMSPLRLKMELNGHRMAPRCETLGPRWCQDGPKMRHSGAHLGPRWSQEGVHGAKMGPRCGTVGPILVQDGAKRGFLRELTWLCEGGSLAARPRGSNGVVTGLFICGISNGVVVPREGQQ